MRGWIAAVLVVAGCAGASSSTTAGSEPQPESAPAPVVVADPPSAPPAPPPELALPSTGEGRTEGATPQPDSSTQIESEGEGEGEGESESASEVETASTSTSVGGPNEGSLLGGIALPTRAPGLRSNPRRPNPTGYYGTFELIHSLVDAAAIVRRELPGGELTVSDIGLPQGGPIEHHGSHRAGRDVDVLFYMLDMDGAPRRALTVPIEPDGHGTDFGDLHVADDDVDVRLDVPRTWRLVQALVENEDALVQRIFLVEHVRTMLLEEAARVHAPRRAIRRFEEVTCQPAVPHDDHLHVRYFCTTEDLAGGCEDASPIYPWRRAQLEAAGVEPVLAHPSRRPTYDTAPVEIDPTIDEAARAFLARREVWRVQPHPGRPYCR
jgi:penicillin-insensitive murein endopeptidase